MPAFEAALTAGFGMECDVRLSRDGVPFVFHDETLDRLTQATGRMDARDAADLDRLRLPDGSALPRLAALLGTVGGKAPLLIEAKAERARKAAPLAQAIVDALADYRGPVGVMSFNPLVPRWLRRHAPAIVRGLVVSETDPPDEARSVLHRWTGAVRRTLDMAAAHPDFLAYDVRDLSSPFVARARRRGMPVVSWTVRSAVQRAIVARYADAPIFEGDGRG